MRYLIDIFNTYFTDYIQVSQLILQEQLNSVSDLAENRLPSASVGDNILPQVGSGGNENAPTLEPLFPQNDREVSAGDSLFDVSPNNILLVEHNTAIERAKRSEADNARLRSKVASLENQIYSKV